MTRAVTPDLAYRRRAQLADAGLLQGTTTAAFTITSATDAGIRIVGLLTMTTNRATVLVDRHVGPDDGEGSLTLSEEQDLADYAGRFTDSVSGSLCIDLGARGTS